MDLYKHTRTFPKEEKYRITNQLLRASLSIPTNIAEGSSSSTSKEYARYIKIAISSASEVEYLFRACRDLGFLSKNTYTELKSRIIEIRKMLLGLKNKIINT
jgi:four helix bundle protein